MARKWECQNLLNCHLAISCSWIDNHTSSERGDSGVSADSKKFWIFHTNGYFQAYFWVALGSTKLHPQLGLSLSHFFSDIRLPYPHLKRIPRAFIWTQMLENIFSNKRARAWGNLYVGNPSYVENVQRCGGGLIPQNQDSGNTIQSLIPLPPFQFRFLYRVRKRSFS